MNRRLGIASAGAWFAVCASGVWEEATDNGPAFGIFSLCLFAAAALTLALVTDATAGSPRRAVRTAGVAVASFGALLAGGAAWALPAWMFLFGVGYALMAVTAPLPQRASIARLSAAQFVGIPVLFAAIAAKVGTPDSYGDYPAAEAIAIVTTGVLMVVGLAMVPTSSMRASVLRRDG